MFLMGFFLRLSFELFDFDGVWVEWKKEVIDAMAVIRGLIVELSQNMTFFSKLSKYDQNIFVDLQLLI